MTADEREPTAAGATSPSAAEAAEGPEAAVSDDPIAVLADELAAIDGLAPGERAELLERVHRAVQAELAALDGL